MIRSYDHDHNTKGCSVCRLRYEQERQVVVQGTSEVGPWMIPPRQRSEDRSRWLWFCRTIVARIEAVRAQEGY